MGFEIDQTWVAEQVARLGPPTDEQAAVLLRVLGPHARAVRDRRVALARSVFVDPAPVPADDGGRAA
ncbi:hypothetical protein GCM10009809_08180 [Isoptericola hypogeus]|uniref:Uncharacterized protein n=1 Tax=Isoptericola hypogeus TaxID=300179 RepID=A0ABP4UYY0_9MICO